MSRPETSEYAAYYERYVSLVPSSEILNALQEEQRSSVAFLKSIAEETSNRRYEPGKWSIKELVGHVIDTERIFSYRALRFGRGDTTVLPGFDQDAFVFGANYSEVSFTDIVAEYDAVRNGTVWLYKNLPREAWNRRGTANKNEISVRAIAYVTAGHQIHHMTILRERYL